MTFINWIGIGLCVAIILSGLTLLRYVRKKKENLDGAGGILKPEEEAKAS